MGSSKSAKRNRRRKRVASQAATIRAQRRADERRRHDEQMAVASRQLDATAASRKQSAVAGRAREKQAAPAVSAAPAAPVPVDRTHDRRAGGRRHPVNWRLWRSNQPGGWVMAMSPALAGVVLGRVGWNAFWLFCLWALCYCVQFTAARWFKSHFRPTYLAPMLSYVIVLALAGLPFVVLHPGILRWAPWFVLLVAVSMLGAYLRRERSLWANAAAVLASCSMVPVIYSYSAGILEIFQPALDRRPGLHTWWPPYSLEQTAVTCALAFVALQFASVLFVKTMIRNRGSRAYYAASITWCILVAFAGFETNLTLGILGCLLALKATILPPISLARRWPPKAAGIAEAVTAVVGFFMIVCSLY
ncbi:YwiC-like family protein [Bifidobacterium choloepi]|uniref:YwiC-like family protein n=1 Tax=Bifidobacterium choloepi TaxID=2614131 RepID=A0A6I5NB19_9BIFI|nr:YwiC-like family protein [Bifidobacterium choloepi]NEG69660.1 YwiC-like family protein [Bifidobacterium choloepi]